MLGSVDLALLFAFLIGSLFFACFRSSIRYRNSPLLLLLLAVVLLTNFCVKVLSHIDYFRNLSLFYYVVYLDLLAGFAAGPTLWLLAGGPGRIARRLWHYGFCLPPFLLFILYVLRELPAQQQQVLAILNGEDWFYNGLNVALVVQFSVYLVGSFIRAGFSRLRLAGFLAAYAAVVLASGYYHFELFRLDGYFFLMSALACSVFAVLGAFTVLFPGREAGKVPPDRKDTEARAQAIVSYFEAGKPYLEKRLTLSSLAVKMGYGRNDLSATINACFGKSFTRFVNEFRVEEAKRRLVDPASDHVKIEYVGYESGFSSKGSFFTIFKQHTGCTPQAYRSHQRNGAAAARRLPASLIVFLLVVACLVPWATCRLAPQAVAVKRLSGTYHSQTPFHGAIRLSLFADGTSSFDWYSNNGASSLSSRGPYTLTDDRIDFQGSGRASDGGTDNDAKDTIDYSYRGSLTYSKIKRRWVGEIWSGMPGWEMEDTARLSLREGLDPALMVRHVLRMKGYIFWGLFLLLLFSLRRTSRRPS